MAKTAKLILEEEQTQAFKGMKKLNGSTQEWHLRQAVAQYVENLKLAYGKELAKKIEEVQNEN